jgi:hypothetical protein
MKRTPNAFLQKAARADTSSAARIDGSAGPGGIAIAPPAYGLDFADRSPRAALDPIRDKTHDRPVAAPRLNVKNFSLVASSAGRGASRPHADKSLASSDWEQDKMLSSGLFQTENTAQPLGAPRGIGIEVDASTWVRTLARTGLGIVGGGAVGAGVGAAVSGVGAIPGAVVGGVAGGIAAGLSAEYQWTQTIDTDSPLHGAVSPYVDPHPNDDPEGAPFYYTGAEAKRFGNHFVDHPSRIPDAAKASRSSRASNTASP